MMSSFRPDFEPIAAGFVSVPLLGIQLREGEAPLGDFQVEAHDEAQDAPAPTGVSLDERSEEEVRAYSEEEIAALESAAFERGVESARADASALESVSAALEDAAIELARLSNSTLLAQRDALLELARRIARHWVGAELRLAPERLADAVDRALAALAAETSLTCRLSVQDHQTLSSRLPDRLATWQEAGVIRVEASEEVRAGSFMIEDAAGGSAGGIDGDLDRIARDLGSVFESFLAEFEEAGEGAEPGSPSDVRHEIARAREDDSSEDVS